MLMANKVIKWKVFLSKRSTVHTHTALSATRLQKIVEPALQFDKNCTQNPDFLQKVDFCIFEPKNREVIENYSKAPLNFS